MKKIRRILLVLAAVFLAYACQDDLNPEFSLKDSIYFQYEYTEGSFTVSYDSISFSFGMLADSIHYDTIPVVVKLMGDMSDSEREYDVRVVEEGDYVEGKTNAEAGVHYMGFDDESHIFGPGRIEDTLWLVLIRDNMSSSHIEMEHRRLILKLFENDDFGLGMVEGLEMKIDVNNYLAKPMWWDKWEHTLSFYHPEKWLVLISFNSEFKNSVELPADFGGNYMNTISTSLRRYLDDNVVLDKETGERVLMDMLVPYIN